MQLSSFIKTCTHHPKKPFHPILHMRPVLLWVERWVFVESVKVCARTNLDLVSPSEALELPKPHVLRLHPPLPAGRTLLRAFTCEHHDQPAAKQEDGYDTPDRVTFCQDFLTDCRTETKKPFLPKDCFPPVSHVLSSTPWDAWINNYQSLLI